MSRKSGLLFRVPQVDHGEFYSLPPEQQDRVTRLLMVIERIDQASRKVVALQDEAERLGCERGLSWRNLRTLYYSYIRGGDWRVLKNKALENGRKRLNQDFFNYVHRLCDRHARAMNSAIDELYARWYAGEEIPGYGTWREWWAKQARFSERPLPAACPRQLPQGWSRTNLQRLKPPTEQRILAHRGVAAYLDQAPSCISTREGLRPYEFLVFDDAETDFLITVPSVAQVCKLEGLFCKDIATDMWLRFGLRPGIKMDDGSRQSLKRQDMLELAVQILTHIGYPRDYVSTWIVERGTATISEADAQAIFEATDGHVVIQRTGMINGRVLYDGYSDKAIGNYRGKGWIESGFNLLWNKLDHIEGQKGRRFDVMPRELPTRTDAAVDLMRFGKLLPPDLALRERLPMQDLRQAFLSVNQALLVINSRSNATCEAFQQVTEWTFPDLDIMEPQPYSKLLSLPAEVRDRVRVSRRTEKPIERLARLTDEHGVVLDRLHPAAACRILNDYHRRVTVQSGEIQVTIDKTTYRYFDPDSPICAQEDGTEYLAYVPKGDFDMIYLTDGKRQFQGTLPRRIAPKYGDLDARNRQLADKRRRLARHVKEINRRNLDDINRAIAETDINLDLVQRLDGGIVGPGQGNLVMSPVVARLSEQRAAEKAVAAEQKAAEKEREDLSRMAREAILANAR